MKDEERKELKEKLKKQIDEMSDEELEKVAGGAWGQEDIPDCTFYCDKCGKEFKSVDEIKNHVCGQ